MTNMDMATATTPETPTPGPTTAVATVTTEPNLANSNHTSAFNEFLQKKYGISVGHGMFYESYVTSGPPHKPTHRCTLQVRSLDPNLDHLVVSAPCDTVKNSKKDACRLMHAWFLTESSENIPIDKVESHAAVSLDAMLGDCVLKLLLLESNDAPRDEKPGTLHDWVKARSTNIFLFDRYRDLSSTGALPPGLPPATGQAHADPTAFEAWIGRVWQANGRDLSATAAVVSPSLGLATNKLLEIGLVPATAERKELPPPVLATDTQKKPVLE